MNVHEQEPGSGASNGDGHVHEAREILGTVDLIVRLEGILLRHIVFKDKRYALLIAVWILGSSVFSVFTFFGYVWLNSPVKRCGKSLLLDILHELCLDATPRLNNASVATIFRIADQKKIMLLDEAENLNGEDKARYAEIMTLLNAGFQAGAKVPRCEKLDGDWVVTYFDAYCPKVLAGIKALPDTIEDRSFKIPMIRKSKKENAERFILRKQTTQLKEIRRLVSLWSMAKKIRAQQVYDQIESIPELTALDDRLLDIAEPLFVIASIADEEELNGSRRVWPDLRDILLIMGGRRADVEKNTAIGAMVELLKDELGEEEEAFLPNAYLLSKAQETDGLKWIKSKTSLGRFLNKLDLFGKHSEDKKQRGYNVTKQWLEDIENRYVSS